MRRTFPLAGMLVLTLLFASCGDKDDDDDDDDDCNEALIFTYYEDADADGYGFARSFIDACAQPTGYVRDNTDCDDTDAAANPGATEVCDGIDNDCDGEIDEDVTTIYYRDNDGDGYGYGWSGEVCDKPSGYVTDSTDCDDSVASIHPGAEEVCNGDDDDCDGVIDEDLDQFEFYYDGDGDGWGLDDDTVLDCELPPDYAFNGGDCDDENADVFPGADEVCNGEDDDCDGIMPSDEVDGDGDGYLACEDCDDTNRRVRPGMREFCDGIDNDCDGDIDEGCASSVGF